MYPPQQMVQVPPDVPSTLFIQGVPHRPPFIPPIQSRPMVNDWLGGMVGYLIYGMQHAANASVTRKALFWRMSPNGYQNPAFFEMVASGMDMLDYVVAVGRKHPQQALPEVSEQLIACMAALEVTYNAGLRQMMSPEQNQETDYWLNFYNQMAGAVSNYVRTVAMQQPQAGGGYGARGAGGTGGGNIYNQIPGYPAGGGGGYPPQQQPQVAYGGYPQQRPQQHAAMAYGGGGSGHRPPQIGSNDAISRAMAQNRDMVVEQAAPVQQPVQQRQQPVPTFQQPVAAAPVQQPPPKPSSSFEEYHFDGEEVTMPNVEREPTATSKRKLTPFSRGNFFTLYNPVKEQSFLVTDERGTTELLLNRVGDEVDYNKHETIHFFKNRVHQDINLEAEYKNAKTAFMQIVHQKNIDVSLEEHRKLTANITDSNGDPLAISVPFIINEPVVSFASVPIPDDLTAWAAENKHTIDLTQIPITYLRMGVAHHTFGGELAVKMMELENTGSWEVLVDRMLRLREDMPRIMWNRLHDDMTDAVNELLRCRMGVSASIDSLVEDIDGLRAGLEKRYGVAYSEAFDRAARQVAGMCCQVVENNCDFYKQMFDAPPDGELRVAPATAEQITTLPLYSHQLVMQYEGYAGRVREDGEYAALHQAIVRLMNVVDEDVHVRHYKLITLDGDVIYVYQSAFDSSVFLISKKDK